MVDSSRGRTGPKPPLDPRARELAALRWFLGQTQHGANPDARAWAEQRVAELVEALRACPVITTSGVRLRVRAIDGGRELTVESFFALERRDALAYVEDVQAFEILRRILARALDRQRAARGD